MDIHFKKDFMKKLHLPDDMIFLIAEYAQEVVPFKKELLEKKMDVYECIVCCNSNQESFYALKKSYHNTMCEMVIETLYDRCYADHNCINTMLDLYDSMFHGFKYLDEIKDEFTELNTTKGFNDLCKIRYKKLFKNLTGIQLSEFMKWYIMHYD